MTVPESVDSMSEGFPELPSALVVVELRGDEGAQLVLKVKPSTSMSSLLKVWSIYVESQSSSVAVDPARLRVYGACGPIPRSDTISQLLFVPSEFAELSLRVKRKSVESSPPIELVRIAILDDENQRTLVRAAPDAEILDVRRFWIEKHNQNPKRFSLLYDDRIIPDNFKVGQILPPDKREVAVFMRRKERKG